MIRLLARSLSWKCSIPLRAFIIPHRVSYSSFRRTRKFFTFFELSKPYISLILAVLPVKYPPKLYATAMVPIDSLLQRRYRTFQAEHLFLALHCRGTFCSELKARAPSLPSLSTLAVQFRLKQQIQAILGFVDQVKAAYRGTSHERPTRSSYFTPGTKQWSFFPQYPLLYFWTYSLALRIQKRVLTYQKPKSILVGRKEERVESLFVPNLPPGQVLPFVGESLPWPRTGLRRRFALDIYLAAKAWRYIKVDPQELEQDEEDEIEREEQLVEEACLSILARPMNGLIKNMTFMNVAVFNKFVELGNSRGDDENFGYFWDVGFSERYIEGFRSCINRSQTGASQSRQTRIQQYLQNEHYALWEVIEFGDSYEAPQEVADTGSTSKGSPKKKGRTVAVTTEDMQKGMNDVKVRTTLLLALLDEHQLRFSKYKTAQELWAAILKTFSGNEATEKTKKNQLKQQYGHFKSEGKETLEQTFNRLQAIVSHLEFMDVEIEQYDLNQKFLTSLAPEWLMYTIVS
nr:ribonuclease H-like domain-containing protein [Tanacetum cinerariifolium]